MILQSNLTVTLHHILLSASKPESIYLSYKIHPYRAYWSYAEVSVVLITPCHALISPPRGDAVTFLLGKVGRKNKVYSSLFPVPLRIVPENQHRRPKLRSLCAIFVELVSPCSSGISIRKLICSQISATFYSFSFIRCQGEICFFSQFRTQAGEKGDID